jgi:hypothetical protein
VVVQNSEYDLFIAGLRDRVSYHYNLYAFHHSNRLPSQFPLNHAILGRESSKTSAAVSNLIPCFFTTLWVLPSTLGSTK